MILHREVKHSDLCFILRGRIGPGEKEVERLLCDDTLGNRG